MISVLARASGIEAVGVVLPVRDEAGHLGATLASLELATGHGALRGVDCRICVVLDSCVDGSARIARAWRRHLRARRDGTTALVVRCRSGNVGAARRLGCAVLLQRWAAVSPSRLWLATTDADSEVPTDWLAVQLRRRAEGCDLWAGRVAVADWSPRDAGTARVWDRRYRAEHAPIHGANLAVNGAAYLAVGGFRSLRTGEDRALHQAIAASGGTVCYDALAPVVTSARRRARAPLGFAHALSQMETPSPLLLADLRA